MKRRASSSTNTRKRSNDGGVRTILTVCLAFAMLGSIFWNPPTYEAAEEPTGQSVDAPRADVGGFKTAEMTRSSFDLLATAAFAQESSPRLAPTQQRKAFDLSAWTKQTQGGLKDADRIMLGDLYGSAASVFEWGLGESTYIAAEVGVPRYGGIDSDPVWVASARDQSPDRFRFYLGDIGPTGVWGRPNTQRLPKAFVNYQVAPLLAEERAFAVYTVDGRMRLPCALAAFLHASSRGRNPSERSPRVLIHDYYHEVHSQGCSECRNFRWQAVFHRIEEVADLVAHSGGMLAVFRRKPSVTDEEILRLWNEIAFGES